MKEVKEEKKQSKTPNRSVLKNLKSTYKYAKSGKKYLFLFFISNIAMTIISVAIPIVIAKRLVILTSGVFEKLLGVIILTFIIEILSNLVRYFSNYSYNKFYYDVRRNLQVELIRETLKITQKDLNTNSTGVFIERVNNDTDNLTDIFASLIDYITSIAGSISVLASIFFINIYLGIAYILLIIVIIFYNKYASNINYKNRKEWKKSREKTGGFVSEIIRGAKDIKILDAEESFLSKANTYLEETNKVSYKYQRTRASLRLMGGSIRDIGDLIISILVYLLLTASMLSIEQVLIVYNYHSRIKSTADWIEQVFEILKQFNLADNRIFGIL